MASAAAAPLLVLFHHTLLMLPDFADVEWHVPGAVPHGAVEWLLLRTAMRPAPDGVGRPVLSPLIKLIPNTPTAEVLAHPQ